MDRNHVKHIPVGSMPLGKKEDGGELAFFVGLLVMLPLRAKVGARVLTIARLLGAGLFLYLLDALVHLHSTPIGLRTHHGALTVYGVALTAGGFYARFRRWRELRRGELWPTYSHGISYFESLNLRRDRVYRFVDPLAAFLLALCIKNLGFTALGVFLMFSAVCFFVVEQHSYMKKLDQDLNECDALLDARNRAVMMTGADYKTASPQDIRETGGVVTGVDSDLAAQIERRRRQAASDRRSNDTEVSQ